MSESIVVGYVHVVLPFIGPEEITVAPTIYRTFEEAQEVASQHSHLAVYGLVDVTQR